MTHETLESYIDAVNEGTMKDRIFLRFLSETVDLARVWDSLPTGEHSNECSYHIYFIKNQQQIYVGAVVDMGCRNLHVFVKEEHRKQGHLSRALQEWILPHLFSDGRPYQHVTYEERDARRHALKVGFTRIEKGKAEISQDKVKFRSEMELQGQNHCISEAEYKEIRRKISHAAGLLRMVEDQLEMAWNKSDLFDNAIKFIIDRLCDIHDIYLQQFSWNETLEQQEYKKLEQYFWNEILNQWEYKRQETNP